jgi:hypothetical protein
MIIPIKGVFSTAISYRGLKRRTPLVLNRFFCQLHVLRLGLYELSVLFRATPVRLNRVRPRLSRIRWVSPIKNLLFGGVPSMGGLVALVLTMPLNVVLGTMKINAATEMARRQSCSPSLPRSDAQGSS